MTELEKLYADLPSPIFGRKPREVSEFTDHSIVGMIDELKTTRNGQQTISSSISETQAVIDKLNRRLASFRYIEAFNAERTAAAETALAKLLMARVSK